jgi:hypothetical protein
MQTEIIFIYDFLSILTLVINILVAVINYILYSIIKLP